jgi:hypothetical protein
MLQQNRAQVLGKMAAATAGLDVGGWHRPINAATHVLDINDYATRLTQLAWDPEASPRFSAQTWHQFDICDHRPWPFPDKFFDFSVCSHVLEDIRDPIWVVAELSRVCKAGYLECPTPASELVSYDGRMVGNAHHRWFVDFRAAPGSVQFRMKPHDLLAQGRFVRATRLHQVDFDRLADGVFWEGSIAGKETIFDIGAYIDSILPATRGLVHFRPLGRIADKLQRLSRPPATDVPVQPHHGVNGVKYPYL